MSSQSKSAHRKWRKQRTHNTRKKYNASSNKTLKKKKIQADKSNSHFDKNLSIAKQVYNERIKQGLPDFQPIDGINYYLKKSNKALVNKDIGTLMMCIAFLSVYAGTYNSESSVNLSNLKFPGLDINYTLERTPNLFIEKVEDAYTRKMKRYEEKLQKKSSRLSRMKAKKEKKGKVQ